MTEHALARHFSDMPSRELSAKPPRALVSGPAIHVPSHTSQRQRVTVFLPGALLERLRNAVYWTERRPLAQIVADAVEDAVTELEQANGGAFPARLAPLKAGRPRRARLSGPVSPGLPVAKERA